MAEIPQRLLCRLTPPIAVTNARDSIHGGRTFLAKNKHLFGTLIDPFIRGHYCPLGPRNKELSEKPTKKTPKMASTEHAIRIKSVVG